MGLPKISAGLESVAFKTPLGYFELWADSEKLRYAGFAKTRPSSREKEQGRANPVLKLAQKELEAYFRGELREFTAPYSLEGTPFRVKVWNELARIPFGEVISYQELACRIGQPKACRAVGQANHHNPLAIIVPCHRVIGKQGQLVGYGSGLDKKSWLLALEKNGYQGEVLS